MEGLLGIQCPGYAAAQNTTSYVPPPITTAVEEPKVPEMLEIVTSSVSSFSLDEGPHSVDDSTSIQKPTPIEPEMTPEVTKTTKTDPGVLMRESVQL